MMCSDLFDFNEIVDFKKRMVIEYSMLKWIIDYWVIYFGFEEIEIIL